MAASISVRFRTDSRWPDGTAFGSAAGSYQGANATSDASAIPATATSTTNAHSRRAPLATSMTPPHPRVQRLVPAPQDSITRPGVRLSHLSDGWGVGSVARKPEIGPARTDRGAGPRGGDRRLRVQPAA